MRNGSAVEVNLVGSDGMAGPRRLPRKCHLSDGGRLFGAGHVPADEVADFLPRSLGSPPLLKVLHGYTQAVSRFRAQAIACDRFHAVELELLDGCSKWTTVCRKTSSR